MIIWGGYNSVVKLNTGGVYDPTTDSWTATTTTNVGEARNDHTAVWTGSKMIIFGGVNDFASFDTGFIYDPTTDSWTEATSATSVFEYGASDHIAVWTGTKMIVWKNVSLFLPGPW